MKLNNSAWLAALILMVAFSPAVFASRVKDLTQVEGARDNQLTGYGIVVGLAGDGDSQLSYTVQSVSNFLKRFGIVVDPGTIPEEVTEKLDLLKELFQSAAPEEEA